MQKTTKLLITLLALLITFIVMQGCSSENPVSQESVIIEKTEYNKIIEEYISALDNGDAAKLKSLFSPKAQVEDENLETEINDLINLFQAETTIKYIDFGVVETSHVSNGDKEQASIHTRFPISINGDYYWFDYMITYRDDMDESNIGINKLSILNKYEMYKFENNNSMSVDGSIGLNLLVHTDGGFNIRCIEGHPYMYNDKGSLDLDDVKRHLKRSLKYSDFVDAFGEPNTKDRYYIYELPKENDEVRYISIMLIGNTDEINNVRIVDDLKCKEVIIGS